MAEVSLTRDMEQIAPTQSVLNGDDDESMPELDVSHVAEAQTLSRGEGAASNRPLSYSQSRKIADENNDKLMKAMMVLSGSMEESQDQNFRIDGKVQV